MSFLDSIINSLSNSAKNTANQTLNNAVSSAKTSARKAVNNMTNDASKAIQKAIATKTKTFTFQSIPTSVEELKALPGGDMKDPFASIAMTVLALNMYYNDSTVGREAIDYVMGPGDLSNLEASRIDMSIKENGKQVALSYFEGAKPENNYTPNQPYVIKVYEYATSSKQLLDEGYYRLFVKSGGADSERQVTVRNKKSTGEWFAHEFSSLYMGIRVAVKDDEWA